MEIVTPNPAPSKKSNSRIVFMLSTIVVSMFVFAVFIMPPLYDIFCEITGLNGKSDTLARQSIVDFDPQKSTLLTAPLSTSSGTTSATAEYSDAKTEHTESATSTRPTKTLQFLADTHPDMPWNFKPSTFSMKISPGQRHHTVFLVKNTTNKPMMGQAVPSVTPGHMAQYLKKIECFCFTQQTLAPFEEKEMPLSFYLSEDAPDDISTLTLSYMLYNITEAAPAEADNQQQSQEPSQASNTSASIGREKRENTET